jgi:hypothetical protein
MKSSASGKHRVNISCFFTWDPILTSSDGTGDGRTLSTETG